MGVKGEVAKETFYSAFLVAYSDELIRQKETEIYGTKDPERLARIQEEMDRLLSWPWWLQHRLLPTVKSMLRVLTRIV